MPPTHPDAAKLATTASIRDVAREAGVSVTTISRVLNSTAVVATATRQRALAAIARLNYVPHSGARSLITKRTQTIGVVLPDVFGEFFSELMRGLDQTARASHHHVLLSGSHSDLGEVQAVVHALRGRVDGLIVMSPDVDALPFLTGYARTLPIVLLNCGSSCEGFDSVGIDNYGGARALVGHLVGLGHRRIAMIGGPADNVDASERARGWHDTLSEAGVPVAAELEIAGDFREASGHAAGLAMAGFSRRPTAVFAANDAMAVGCLSAFSGLGWRVPEDIALGGFDDVPIARYLNPPLTTVRVPIAELGNRTMQRLLARLADRDEAHHYRDVVSTELVIRASCGGQPARARLTEGGSK